MTAPASQDFLPDLPALGPTEENDRAQGTGLRSRTLFWRGTISTSIGKRLSTSQPPPEKRADIRRKMAASLAQRRAVLSLRMTPTTRL